MLPPSALCGLDYVLRFPSNPSRPSSTREDQLATAAAETQQLLTFQPTLVRSPNQHVTRPTPPSETE